MYCSDLLNYKYIFYLFTINIYFIYLYILFIFTTIETDMVKYPLIDINVSSLKSLRF